MNAALLLWLQQTGLLALEAGLIVVAATSLQRWTQSAGWRRAIGQMCILSLLLLVIFDFSGAGYRLVSWMKHPGASPAPAAIAINTTTPSSSPTAKMPISIDPLSIEATPTLQSQRTPQATNFSVTKTADSSEYKTLLVMLPGMIWLIGLITVLGRILAARMILEIFRQRRRRIHDAALEATVNSLASRLGMKRKVRLIESARFYGPVAFGVVRPTIGLPPQFTAKFTAPQCEAMLAHELAHLAGGDPGWYLLADILTAALWWHPLIWWARHRLHAVSELAADDASLLVADGPDVLAECLVEIGAQLTRQPLLLPLGVSGNGFRSSLGQRVERLINLKPGQCHPVNPLGCGLARTLGPVTLVIVIILCTAWILPPASTQGENMQSTKQSWKKPLAAVALLATLAQTEPLVVHADSSTLEAASNHAQSVSTSSVGTSGSFTINTQLEPSKERQAVEAKLQKIVLEEIAFDGLPLEEVLRRLNEISVQHDPAKIGINFILNRAQPPPYNTGFDPNTGMPAPLRDIDVGATSIRVMPLKHVRLIDVLEVMTKSADASIKYSIEDYGVMFSVTASPGKSSVQLLDPQQVKLFRVDTNTFFVGLDRAFQLPLDKNIAPPENARQAIVQLLAKLGVNSPETERSVVYNDVTGIVMMRGTSKDLRLVEAAIETLGGK